MAFHPEVEKFLARSQQLSQALEAVERAAFDDLRVRRAAPNEPDVMPEVDGWGELKSLYLGEGVVDRYNAHEVEQLVMSGLSECYAVLDDRRREAASKAAPELNLWEAVEKEQQEHASDEDDEWVDDDEEIRA